MRRTVDDKLKFFILRRISLLQPPSAAAGGQGIGAVAGGQSGNQSGSASTAGASAIGSSVGSPDQSSSKVPSQVRLSFAGQKYFINVHLKSFFAVLRFS